MKKSKRFLSLVLTMVCAFGFLGACKPEEEHVHNYKSYVYKEATCLQGGVIEKLCLDCGDKKYEETPKTDSHDYVWTTIKQATCKEDGSKEGTCRDCGNKQTQVVLKGEHQYEWTTIKQANCKIDGTREGTCIYCQDKKTESVPKGEHQYVWQVTKDATCFSEGSARGICADCGKETTKALPKTAHQYVNGTCSICFNTNIVETLLQGQKLGYTLTDVVNIIDSYGYYSNIEDLVDEIIKISVNNEKLQFEYGYRDYYRLAFGIDNMISDFAVKVQEERIIEGIVVKVVENVPQLCVIYKDGSTIPVGYISEYVEYGNYSSNNVVKSVAINKQNQFLAVYENNNVALFGTIAEVTGNVAPNVLYMQTGDTYTCSGFLDRNSTQTEITIAPSHMGKIVDSVEEYAFSGNKYLEKVTLSDEIKAIGRLAFYNCNKLKKIDLKKGLEKIETSAFEACNMLEEITLPVTCTEIGAYAFYYCKSLTKINYEGSVKQWEEITLGRGWSYNSTITEVICSNGRVTLN